MSNPEPEKKGPRKRKQKEQDAPGDPEHKDITQPGAPKHKEKGKQDKGDEKKQEGTTKTNKDEGEAADKRNENGHKDNIQTKGCQPQLKDILLAVCVCAIVLLTVYAFVLLTVYAWRVDSQYRTEVAHLQEKVEAMIESHEDMLSTLDKKIEGLTASVNNAATKQEVNSKIAQLDTKIKAIPKCKKR